MSDTATPPDYLTASAGRRLAYRFDRGVDTPGGVFWLGGYGSDMSGDKALALADWACRRGCSALRFDYSGHGESTGKFADGLIGHWLDDAERVFCRLAQGPQIVVGSSMGGWLAILLAARLESLRDHPAFADPALAATAEDRATAQNAAALRVNDAEIAAFVLIAPAFDMVSALMSAKLTASQRDRLDRDGVVYIESDYGDPYPITRALMEEGAAHQLPPRLDLTQPVHILHGQRDTDVPWEHSLVYLDRFATADITLSLRPRGDHRLSTAQDLTLLVAVVEDLYCRAISKEEKDDG